MRSLLNIPLMIVLATAVTPSLRGDDAPGAGATVPVKEAQKSFTYNGHKFDDWSGSFQTELNPIRRIEILKALIAFGTRERTDEVVTIILNYFDDYRPGLIESVVGGLSGVGPGDLLAGPELPHDLEEDFLDINDAKLFRTAAAGLVLLSKRATPQLVKFLEAPSERTTARLVVLATLMKKDDPSLAVLIPKLVGRDAEFSEHFWGVWNNEHLGFVVSNKVYEPVIQGLLELKAQSHVLNTIESIKRFEFRLVDSNVHSLLAKLKTMTTDPAIQQAIDETLKLREKRLGQAF